MEQSVFKVATDDAIIKSNEKWFKVFLYLPLITTVIFAITFFVLGIVLTIVSPLDEIAMLIFWGGGAIYCPLNYIVMKIVFSYQILHIYYLKKLTKSDTVTSAQDMTDGEDVLPEI